ncbi:methyltransferase domain-containing protein [Acaryochloris sp. IP29b_bin.137]|uniref:class I SAM-dependent methyltransferase n=1 Tax=Acaryochloris sp. IP29b_bin.137 TaxID=2969217 RepID=UPI00263A0F6E|nr:methyltransferase domain-containing protein [Acaryochloris sp. IP29b_bin.137]
MTSTSDWIHDEFKQVGKDYGSSEEVALYDSSHAKFRDVVAESEEILDSLSVSAGQSLVDIGCGTGIFAIQAAKRGLAVTALDISDAMLSCAKSKADEEGVIGIRFLKGGFLNLPESYRSGGLCDQFFLFSSFARFLEIDCTKETAFDSIVFGQIVYSGCCNRGR